MELELHRIDLLQTSAAAPGTMVVLPPGENKTQKVAVGDLSGVLQCFSVKKGEVVLSFKTLPSAAKVTAVVLGRGSKQRDKIFSAAGSTIQGVTKKGQQFFRFATALTEAIGHLRVAESHIWAGCGSLHNHFVEGDDRGMFACPDHILATELLPLSGGPDWLPVVACRDCCVRILGMDGRLLFEISTGSPPMALRYVSEVHGPAGGGLAASAAAGTAARELLYGCEDGRVVQLLVERGAVRQGFVIPGGPAGGAGGGGVRAAVTAIHCGADYTKTGCPDIVVGREDGSVEVWDVDPRGEPRLAASAQLPESVCSLGGGYVTSAAAPDILVHTFRGKVIAFASHPGALALAAAAASRPLWAAGGSGVGMAAAAAAAAAPDLVAALDARIAKETAELTELRAKVARERERFAAAQAEGSGEGAAAAAAAASAVVDVRHRLTLQEDGCFLLFVEAAVSLFALALQATVPLELLDVPGNVALLSKSPPDAAAGNATLATYRCQESTNRLSIRFTAKEGKGGHITAFVIPAVPPKTCPVVQVALPPLCMHRLVSGIQGGGGGQAQEGERAGQGSLAQKLQQSRPCSELSIQGNFSAQDVHAWLRGILPDLPAQLLPGASGGGQLFRECRAGSLLSCEYSGGQASFLCESVSSLVTLHDALLAAATAAGQRVGVRYRVHPQALQHCCGLLWPRLVVQRAAARQQRLAAAIQELAVQEGGDASFLSPELQSMLRAPPDSAGGAGVQQQQQRRQQRQQQRPPQSSSDGGCASDSGAGGQPEAELEGVVEAFRQLLRDHARLASSGSAQAAAQRLPGLERLLHGDAGLAEVAEFIVSGSSGGGVGGARG